MVKKKNPKKRRPKGRPLSQSLREREEQLAAEEARGEEPSKEGQADQDEDDLRSEPPPRADMDDEQDRASGADDHPDDERAEDEDDERAEDEDDERSEDEDDERAEDEDDERAEDEDQEEDEEDEDLAAAQMGHQRYVIAGFFGLWLVAGYLGGLMLEAAWSRFAAKDWFVESLPLLAAVPHEGELVSRASVSLVLGAIFGGAIVLRYYYKPEVRTWADEVAEQITKVKWPTRKEVGNNTVVVIVASTIITLYLTLIDRLWGFVTNLIYSGA